jgi:hypothetical protein
MKVTVSTELACSFDRAVEQAKTSRLLRYVAHPLVHFEPLDPPAFPDEWSVRTYWVKLKLFGFLPFGKQAIAISVLSDKHSFTIRDAGHSAIIKVWDHRMKICRGSNSASYQDEIEIRAGLLTPLVWLFAHVFYRHRQHRLRRLAACDFDYRAARK